MKWYALNKWFQQIRNNRLFYQSFLLMSVIEAEFIGAVMIKEVSHECILNESHTQLSFRIISSLYLLQSCIQYAPRY